MTSRGGFVGTATQVADAIDRHVQEDASDGFILVPHLTPAGLDDVFDQVVPLLQERGSFRTEYERLHAARPPRPDPPGTPRHPLARRPRPRRLTRTPTHP